MSIEPTIQPSPPSRTKSERRRSARSSRKARALKPRTLTARDREIEEVARRVEDPYEAGTSIPVAFNRRVDTLQAEHSHGRLSEQQYAIGRIVEAVFERGAGSTGSGWGEGVRADPVTARELRMIYAVQDAHTIQAYEERIERAVGPIDMRLLRRVLGDRMTFSQASAMVGTGSGDTGVFYVGQRFRHALEELSLKWAARGAAKPEPAGAEPATLPRPARRDRLAELRDAGRIRGERAEAGPPVETDAAGMIVPPGKGFRVATDVDASRRWRPRSKRTEAVAEGERRARNEVRRRG